MALYTEDQKRILKTLYPNDFEDYDIILRTLDKVIEKEVLPRAEEVDGEKIFPKEGMDTLFEEGLVSMSFPPEYGGLGLPYPVYIACMELVSKACASTSISLAIHSTVCEGLRLFASEELKKTWLLEKGLLEGRSLAAFALTEPGCGSDAGAIRTKARLEGDEYVIDGTKTFITNAGVADVYFVFALTDNGPTAFLVEADRPGLSIGKDIPKVGVKGTKTGEVIFEDCRIPSSNLVGTEGKGFKHAKEMLNRGRLTIGVLSVGIAQAALEKALRYSKERKAFGTPISSFQLTQEKFANMVTEINAARLLTYYAASLKEQGVPFASEAAQAKLFASEASVRACDNTIQVLGGYGYADEYDVHRHWRDAKLMTIGEGSSEILRLLIAHMALKAV